LKLCCTGLLWDAMLNMIRVSLELMTRDMVLMIKKGITWNDGERIGCFEERNQEGRGSPYLMKTETQKCATFESEQYDL
jgi:hypothetical protein